MLLGSGSSSFLFNPGSQSMIWFHSYLAWVFPSHTNLGTFSWTYSDSVKLTTWTITVTSRILWRDTMWLLILFPQCSSGSTELSGYSILGPSCHVGSSWRERLQVGLPVSSPSWGLAFMFPPLDARYTRRSFQITPVATQLVIPYSCDSSQLKPPKSWSSVVIERLYEHSAVVLVWYFPFDTGIALWCSMVARTYLKEDMTGNSVMGWRPVRRDQGRRGNRVADSPFLLFLGANVTL